MVNWRWILQQHQHLLGIHRWDLPTWILHWWELFPQCGLAATSLTLSHSRTCHPLAREGWRCKRCPLCQLFKQCTQLLGTFWIHKNIYIVAAIRFSSPVRGFEPRTFWTWLKRLNPPARWHGKDVICGMIPSPASYTNVNRGHVPGHTVGYWDFFCSNLIWTCSTPCWAPMYMM